MTPQNGCARCGGSGLGNICHISREALLAAAADNEIAVTAALVDSLAGLPSNEARAESLSRFLKHHSPEWVDMLRRLVWARMRGGA